MSNFTPKNDFNGGRNGGNFNENSALTSCDMNRLVDNTIHLDQRVTPINRGGTGLDSAPSMRINLNSTNAASPLQAEPRPGVTGVLPIPNGGTGVTSVGANQVFAGPRNGSGAPSWRADFVPGTSRLLRGNSVGGIETIQAAANQLVLGNGDSIADGAGMTNGLNRQVLMTGGPGTIPRWQNTTRTWGFLAGAGANIYFSGAYQTELVTITNLSGAQFHVWAQPPFNHFFTMRLMETLTIARSLGSLSVVVRLVSQGGSITTQQVTGNVQIVAASGQARGIITVSEGMI